MKKLLFIFIIVFIFSGVYAINPKKILTIIPDNFKPECHQYYKKVKMHDIWWYGDTYKLLVNKKDLLITHFGFILPYKRLSDTTIVIKRFYDSYIELYSGYNCKGNFSIKAKEYKNFSINKNTKTVEANLTKNPKYGIYNKKDFDNDWVADKKDNCKYYYNPNQEDTNADGKGDICMDDDKDGIIGRNDNCPNVFNPGQNDSNLNGIGNACEFDKDKDGILDPKDNCINIPNTDQKDTDKDGVGNACDNCSYYNPAQLDYNNNKIGDICETIEKKEQVKKNKIKQELIKKEKIKKDKDLDNILNEKDNCINMSNPNQKDIDNDGIGDACDNSDDRFTQKYKGFFMFLLFISSMIFSGGIFYIFGNKNKS